MKKIYLIESYVAFIFVQKMRSKTTKTYLGSTGSNSGAEDDTVTFHVNFPIGFVNSTNRRFITVMPPRLLWGGNYAKGIRPSLPMTFTSDSTIADNMYIMHCSFIHTNPYHDKAAINVNDSKRKYKTYEYKGSADGFDITFTDYFPASDIPGWYIGLKYNDNLPDFSYNYDDMLLYFQTLFPNIESSLAENMANQCLDLYMEVFQGIDPDIPFYRNNQRFKKNSKTEYVTDFTEHDWYDYVSYVVDQNNLSLPLQFQEKNSSSVVNGDYVEYTIQTSYIDYNINCYVSHTRYIKYKIFKDKMPWYYYAEFMVEY